MEKKKIEPTIVFKEKKVLKSTLFIIKEMSKGDARNQRFFPDEIMVKLEVLSVLYFKFESNGQIETFWILI